MALQHEKFQPIIPDSKIILPSTELTPKDLAYYSHHAEKLGNKVSSERLFHVAEKSNSDHFQFHGVKYYDYVDNVVALGIQPRTSEGGPASYWASGTALYGQYPSIGSLSTFNSPLYNWGHSRANDGNSHMTIAVVKDQPEFKPNNEILLHRVVSPYELMLLRVSLQRREGENGRSQGQEIECKMFELLEEAVVHGGFKPGVELAYGSKL